MHDKPTRRSSEPLWMRMGVLAFGIFALVFLAAVERPHWFHIRPATGTAVALSSASTVTADVVRR